MPKEKENYQESKHQESHTQARQQRQEQPSTPPVDTNQLLAALSQVASALQDQARRQPPQPFEGAAAAGAVEVFNGILSGLQFKPAPDAPDNVQATATSKTEITLAWNWSGQPGDADGFRISRCQGGDCANFSRIEEKLPPGERSYIDRNLSSGETYRYKISALRFGRESAFSGIGEATTQS